MLAKQLFLSILMAVPFVACQENDIDQLTTITEIKELISDIKNKSYREKTGDVINNLKSIEKKIRKNESLLNLKKLTELSKILKNLNSCGDLKQNGNSRTKLDKRTLIKIDNSLKKLKNFNVVDDGVVNLEYGFDSDTNTNRKPNKGGRKKGKCYRREDRNSESDLK